MSKASRARELAEALAAEEERVRALAAAQKPQRSKFRPFIHWRSDAYYEFGILQVGRVGIPVFILAIFWGVALAISFVVAASAKGNPEADVVFFSLFGVALLIGLIVGLTQAFKAIAWHIRRASKSV